MNYLTRLFLKGCSIAIVVGTFMLPAYGADVYDITVGSPMNAGSIEFKVLSGGRRIPFEVVIPPNTTASGKASLIRDAFVLRRVRAVIDPLTPTTVTITGLPEIIMSVDPTREKTTVKKRLPEVIKKVVGSIDFHNFLNGARVLAGIDPNGFESQFQASLGFDGIVADANLNFSALSGNTLDDLLADIYSSLLADLPLTYQSLLSLDLSKDEIQFFFPSGASNVFVENLTTDINTYSSLGLATVPEPSMLSLLISLAAGFSFTRNITIQR